jgi:protein associated with RNAse G/E
MSNTWKPGDTVVLRGMYNNRIWVAQSAIVVKDDDEEIALAILPGAECMMPDGYINGKHGEKREWDRWGDYLNNVPELQRFIWHTNRLLLLMEPQKYYATIYFWQESSSHFLCYYVNFQTPFKRTQCGFDILDLELDIIIEPTFEWSWKDMDDYQQGIECGIIASEWVQAIDTAKQEVFHKLENGQYPFDGFWLNWKPESSWSAPKLPDNWNQAG